MATKLITAGAGSGKTYKVCEEIVEQFAEHREWQPSQLLVTTFTEKAAGELRERITSRLMEEGDFVRISGLSEAYIGTVHGVCLRFLQKYGYLLNLSPELNILPEGEDMNMIGEILDDYPLDEMHRMELRLNQYDTRTRKNNYPDLIRKIIELARINGIDRESLLGSADQSVETYNELLGNSPFDPDVFRRLLQDQYDHFLPIADELKSVNLAFYETVRELLLAYEEGRPAEIPWGNFLKLTSDLTKGFSSVAEPLQEYVRLHHRWPVFKDSLEDYTRGIFSTAAEIMGHYQAKKAAIGVIDFADMELMMMKLMENSHFTEEFSSQFRLVMVDEFQDTNPLQLEIIRRWSEQVSDTVLVGDVKQSIYGFRGADASLVQSVMDGLPDESKIPLEISYRSRKELVEAANSIFVRAFHPIEERYIRLNPCEKVQSGHGMEHPLNILQLDHEDYEQGVASSIQGLISEQRIIFDKQAETYRPVQPSDICILLREEGMNKNITHMLEALLRRQIPVAVSGTLFPRRPEVYFMVGVLRYLVDRNDAHAIARILYYSSEKPSPSTLIEERARFLVENRESEDRKRYGESDPFIRELDNINELARKTGIKQLIEMIIHRTDFESIAGRLGYPDSTREILNRLIGMAGTYSALCVSQKKIESILGFIRFIENSAKSKSRDELIGEGVSVMTYHGAKGLEWPVVFMGSMKNKARANVADPEVISRPETGQALEGRWIRYWPYPYHNKTTKCEVYNLLSDARSGLLSKNREEEKRLIYVGFTRARDYLFLCTGDGAFNWFEECCGQSWRDGIEFQEPTFVPDNEAETAETRIKVLRKTQKAALVSRENYFLSPSKEPVEGDFKLGSSLRLGDYLALNASAAEKDLATLGNLFHHYFAVGINAEQLIAGYNLSHLLNSGHLKESYKRFSKWVEEKYPGVEWHCEWPVNYFENGRMINGIADLVLESEDSLVLIDHKSFQGGGDVLNKHIIDEKYPGQLAWYKKALDASSQKKVAAVYLHFPVTSAIVEVRY